MFNDLHSIKYSGDDELMKCLSIEEIFGKTINRAIEYRDVFRVVISEDEFDSMISDISEFAAEFACNFAETSGENLYTIIHGDPNAANIIVGDDGKYRLIDPKGMFVGVRDMFNHVYSLHTPPPPSQERR
jgi:predicted unusual protein kinase regulating ubiquinone biosynthesis (AarF/ABC1/UbiB family)